MPFKETSLSELKELIGVQGSHFLDQHYPAFEKAVNEGIMNNVNNLLRMGKRHVFYLNITYALDLIPSKFEVEVEGKSHEVRCNKPKIWKVMCNRYSMEGMEELSFEILHSDTTPCECHKECKIKSRCGHKCSNKCNSINRCPRQLSGFDRWKDGRLVKVMAFKITRK